ncbi:transport and Golgi organization protein 1 homolog [Carcharodon carcharias]|uniref:transport and Golgi organization protein 1 homolog n=1 Tax=Carcharodon carcharias TaxID=13397 RepID=UPI001B7F2B2C|nr:transport and Golgi organization protein 1 homolog [Carcharodon carcharias]
MAALLNQMCVSVLLITVISCKEAQQKLFSNFKRCLDEECSMLMCRGKAVQDFTGPDCRFLKFKKGETIYVYYKLAGERNDLWAGSVGSQFGYFPKNLIEVNLIYSTAEVELPVEETDFVCFDGGPDEFDYVDLDHLIRANGETGFNEGKKVSHIATTEESVIEKRHEDTGQKIPDAEFKRIPKVPENKSEENKARDEKEAIVGWKVSDSPSRIEDKGDETVDSIINGEQILHVEDGESEEKPANVGENASSLEEHPTEEDDSSHVKVSAHLETQGLRTSPLKDLESEELSEDTKDTRVSRGENKLLDTAEQGSQDKREDIFELAGSSKLVTTFGSTIDVIVGDDEVTSKVTTLDEDPVYDFELQKDELVESPEKVPLLMYSDTKLQQQPELPEADSVEDEDVGEDYAAKSNETDTKITAQDVNLPVTSVNPEKGQSLDGITEELANIGDENEEKLQAGTSEDENSQKGELWTTLGDTFYAVVTGSETTAKVTDPYSFNSEDIQEDMREGRIEDSEEKDRVYLLSMSEKGVDDKLVNAVNAAIENDAMKERSDIMMEDYKVEDTIQAFVRTSKTDTNLETSYKENEGTEEDQGIRSKAAHQIPGLEKEGESKMNGPTFNEEVDNDEFLKVLERDDQSGKIELQTLEHPSIKDNSSTGMNQSSQKLNQFEQETETENLFGSESRWSRNLSEVLDAGNEELGSQNKIQAAIREQISVEDFHAKRSQDVDEAKEHVMSFGASDEEVEDHKMVNKEYKGLKEYDLAENQRDIGLSLESNSKLTGDDISDQLQEEMNDEDFDVLEEIYTLQPEVLLEDENAAEARMAQNSDPNATDDQEEALDDQDSDVDAEKLKEERNTIELKDRGDDTPIRQKEMPVKVNHEVKEHSDLAQSVQELSDKTESQRESEQLCIRPVHKNALDIVNEDQSRHLKHLSEMSQKDVGKFNEGKGHKTKESRLVGTYSSIENTSNPSEVEENSAEEPAHQRKDIGSEDERKMFAGPRYSEAVEQLTILKGYLNKKSIECLYRYLDSWQVLELEAVLHNLKEELSLGKSSRTNEEDIEKALDFILEESEMRILDMVEEMLDKRAEENHWKIEENSPEHDGETMLLSDVQELMFQLREKYSVSKESDALTPGMKITQESKHLPYGSLDHSKQEEQERDATEAQQEGEEKMKDQPMRGLPSPIFTEDTLHSEGKQEEDEGQEPQGKKQSGNLTESAAYQERKEEGEERVRGPYFPESVKETRKEHPISRSATGQEKEETALELSSSNFTEIAGHPKRTWEEMKDHEEATRTPPPNVTGRAEEIQKETPALVSGRLKEVGSRNDKELERKAPSSNVGGRLEEGEAWRELSILNISEQKEEAQKEPSDVTFAENVAQSDGGDTAEKSWLKEKQQEGKDTAREGDELGHLEVEIETPSTLDNSVIMDKGQLQDEGLFLPWIVTVLDAVVLLIKDNVWPVAQSLLEYLVSSLPEEMRPGPDFRGVPWEPILITAVLGIITFVVFLWRTCLSVKSRKYQMTEKQLSAKIKQLIQEKTEVLEKVSTYEKKLEEAKTVIDEAQNVKCSMSDETKELKETCRELEQVNLHLETRVKNLQALLEKEKEETAKQQTLIADTQKSVKSLQNVISTRSAELSQVQVALSGAKVNEEKLQADIQSMQEENAMLKQSKNQLLQEAEGWSERHSELNEQIKLCQKAQRNLEEMLVYKDNEIEVLTDCVMQLRQLDTESDSEDNGWDKEVDGEVANGELPDKSKRIKMKIQQMMDVSRVQTTLKIIEEEKDHFQAKLTDEIKARHELEEQIKQLEHNFVATGTEKSKLENEFKTMQQKLEILTELYQQKEMALQKKLTQEECQRQEKELKLSAADEKALQAVEEVKMFKQRIQEMEEELHKTERSFKNQIAAHEKKAHENWLSARSAERTLTEEKRETANLRQKMIELNQKLSQVQRPSIIKPTPGRPDFQVPPGAPPPLGVARRGPLSRDDSYGPSPVSGGAPSPPLMMELPVRPPSVNASRGFPRDRGDGGMRVPPGAFAPREWIGPGPDRLGPSSDQGSPPPQWDRRPGPMDGYSGPRRPPSDSGVISGRISGPGEIRGLPPPNRAEMGPGGPAQLASGPRTSSPNLTECAMVNANTLQAAPSFPGTPIMNSPMGGITPLGPRHGPPPSSRGSYGPVPLAQNHLVRVPALRDFPPGPFLPPGPFPPPSHRPFLPGPLPPPPHVLRDIPPGAREYPHGPRNLPPGPTLPPGSREYPPGSHPPEPDNRL